MQWLPNPCTHLSSRSVLASFFLSPHFNLLSFLSAKTSAISLRTCPFSVPLSILPLNPSFIFFGSLLQCFYPALWSRFITSPLIFSSLHPLYFFDPFTSSYSCWIHWLPSSNLSSHLCVSPYFLSCLPSPIPLPTFLYFLTRICSPPVHALICNYSVHSPLCSSKLCFIHSCMLLSLLSICLPLFSVFSVSFSWLFLISQVLFLNWFTSLSISSFCLI